MKSRIITNILIIVFVLITIFALRYDLLYVYALLRNKVVDSPLNLPIIKSEILGKIENLPGPLRNIIKGNQIGELTILGILEETNKERILEGLPPLTLNQKLIDSAEIKAEDMLIQQYFEHISPQKIDVAILAEREGYEYITVGENLALGTFLSDLDVVTAWMNSPGHRANILNTHFTEIGIGVVKGEYEGVVAWLAVQHFGIPLETCPIIDSELREEIEGKQKDLDALAQSIKAVEKEINSLNKISPLYNEKVNEHNSLVDSYNTSLISLKKKIAIYNGGVNNFNECVNTETASFSEGSIMI